LDLRGGKISVLHGGIIGVSMTKEALGDELAEHQAKLEKDRERRRRFENIFGFLTKPL